MEFDFSSRVKNLSGNAIREIFKVLQDPEMITFAGGLPASPCLPSTLIGKFGEKLMASDEAVKILQYGQTEGYLPLRQSMLSYVKRVGIENAELQNCLIISGGQQAIDLSLKCLTNKGDTVLCQTPTYLAFLHIAKTYEVNVKGVDMTESGIDFDDLEKKIVENKPKLLYLVPTFHNPTGNTMTLEERKRIAELSAKYSLVVIEDDPYRELRYYGAPLPSIKSFDKTGNVLYVTSFSKTISPGIRVGAAIGDEKLIAKLTIAKQAVDVHTSNLSQAIVNEFIKDGLVFSLMEKAVPIYREKLEYMIKCLDRYMPSSFTHTNPEGGLFIFGTFDKQSGISASAKFKEAIANKIAYVCGSEFFADGSGENTIRLNFSNASLEQIETGVKRLSKIFG